MRILNDLDTYRLLGAINLRQPFGPRDHAMIRLALQTGLRVSELAGLNVGDVHGAGGARHQLDLVPATCKGNRARQIPLNPAARRAVGELVAFLTQRGFSTAPDAPLLTDRRHRRLPIREIERAVQRYREAAQLDIRATPHTLRHTLASQLVAAGNDLNRVRQLLGHRDLKSTQVYLHASAEEMAGMMEQAGP